MQAIKIMCNHLSLKGLFIYFCLLCFIIVVAIVVVVCTKFCL